MIFVNFRSLWLLGFEVMYTGIAIKTISCRCILFGPMAWSESEIILTNKFLHFYTITCAFQRKFFRFLLYFFSGSLQIFVVEKISFLIRNNK